MRTRLSFLGCFALPLAGIAFAPVAEAADRGIQLQEESTSRWRFGVTVKAVGGALSGVRATLPVRAKTVGWESHDGTCLATVVSGGVSQVGALVAIGWLPPGPAERRQPPVLK